VLVVFNTDSEGSTSDYKFRVEVSTDADFSTIENEIYTDNAYFQMAAPLDGLQRYYRVYTYPQDSKVAYEYPSSSVSLFVDQDGDGLSDALELEMGTDPLLSDTDGDSITDDEDGNPLVSNSAPVLSGTAETSVDEDSSFSFQPEMNDDGDTSTFTFSIENAPAWATFNTETGLLEGSPENDDVGVTSNITISVSDGYLSSSLSAFDIEVINTNDAPLLNDALVAISVTAGDRISQDVSVNFSDIDVGDSLNFSASNLPGGVVISAVGVLSGMATSVGTFDVVITATDLSGATVNGELRITVAAAPVASSGGGTFGAGILFLLVFVGWISRVRGQVP